MAGQGSRSYASASSTTLRDQHHRTRGRALGKGRYLHYLYLADRPIGETINRASTFLNQLIPASNAAQ